MKKLSLVIFIFAWGMAGAIPAHAYDLVQPYPYVLSQPIDILPQGFVTINVGNETYYYCNGIFYQKIMLLQKYVVVPPPIGAVVFDIPRGYELMLIDGMTYYEYGGIYYKLVLEGYRVIFPPV